MRARVLCIDRHRARAAEVVVVAGVLVALSTSAALAGGQRFPITRVHTFSGVLRSGGAVVGRFACRIRISESRTRFSVTTRPESGWLALPQHGRWRLFYEGAADSREAMNGTYRPVNHRRRIAFLPLESSSSSGPRPRGSRYACGLFLMRVGEPLYRAPLSQALPHCVMAEVQFLGRQRARRSRRLGWRLGLVGTTSPSQGSFLNTGPGQRGPVGYGAAVRLPAVWGDQPGPTSSPEPTAAQVRGEPHDADLSTTSGSERSVGRCSSMPIVQLPRRWMTRSPLLPPSWSR